MALVTFGPEEDVVARRVEAGWLLVGVRGTGKQRGVEVGKLVIGVHAVPDGLGLTVAAPAGKLEGQVFLVAADRVVTVRRRRTA